MEALILFGTVHLSLSLSLSLVLSLGFVNLHTIKTDQRENFMAIFSSLYLLPPPPRETVPWVAFLLQAWQAGGVWDMHLVKGKVLKK